MASTSCSRTRSRSPAPSAAYRRLLETAAAAGRRMRYEATVGAGLPVIDTFRKLVESGDRVMRVEGCVSGTLGFVLSSLEAGAPSRRRCARPSRRGYAEPDPREDLSGQDVLRKGLILARLLGYSGPAPAAENLVPPALRRLPLPASSRGSPRSTKVGAGGSRRRPRAGACCATSWWPRRAASPRGLRAVPRESALGALAGTRNLLSFTTRRYRAEPLVVSGPGAGAEVTAAGILNDIQSLASE